MSTYIYKKIVTWSLLLSIVLLPSVVFGAIPPELDIYGEANRIKAMGWQANGKYKMHADGLICVNKSIRCTNISPTGNAANRDFRRGDKYYYGRSIMSKMLMEYILQRKIQFTSGHRDKTIGSNRHHLPPDGGAALAFDLRVLGGLNQKAKVAAAWKFAAQSLGFTASVGMMYSGNPNMVHVDTATSRDVSGTRWWPKGGGVSRTGRMVLSYYGSSRNGYMPYNVLVGALKGKAVRGSVYTGVLNGARTSTLSGKYGVGGGQVQPYQTAAAQRDRQEYYVPVTRDDGYKPYYYAPVYSSGWQEGAPASSAQGSAGTTYYVPVSLDSSTASESPTSFIKPQEKESRWSLFAPLRELFDKRKDDITIITPIKGATKGEYERVWVKKQEDVGAQQDESKGPSFKLLQVESI